MKLQNPTPGARSLVTACLLTLGTGAWAMLPAGGGQGAAAGLAPASSSAASSSAASSTAASAMLPEAAGLPRFDPDRRSIPGYAWQTHLNVKHLVDNRNRIAGREQDLAGFSLSLKPAVWGTKVAIGQENSKGKTHTLMCVDLNAMRHAGQNNPVLGALYLPEALTTAIWMNSFSLLCATGQGNLRLFHHIPTANPPSFNHEATMVDALPGYIREMARRPGTSSEVLLAGGPSTLRYFDIHLAHGPLVRDYELDDSPSSVRWVAGGDTFTATTDGGLLFLFDVRSNHDNPVQAKATQKDKLLANCPYGDHNVLLGYGDGQFHEVDLRMLDRDPVAVQDSFCTAIANIDYHADSHRFVLSGYTDFSVWEVKEGQGRILAHAGLGSGRPGGEDWITGAAFVDSNLIVSGDSDGRLTLTGLPPAAANPAIAAAVAANPAIAAAVADLFAAYAGDPAALAADAAAAAAQLAMAPALAGDPAANAALAHAIVAAGNAAAGNLAAAQLAEAAANAGLAAAQAALAAALAVEGAANAALDPAVAQAAMEDAL